MMKGVMMSATLAVSNHATSGQGGVVANVSGADNQVVTALVDAGKRSFTSQYNVTVKKIEPIPGTNQVRVMLFVTGEDEPAHDFTETGNQVVAQFLNAGMAGMHTNIGGAATATVEKIEPIEGGDDDSDDDSDEDSDGDALSGLTASATTQAPTPAAPTPAEPTSTMTPSAPAGNVPTLPAAPPISGSRPTTSPSSPVQQPGTTQGEAVGEETAQTTPSEHEEPPHQG